MAVYKKQITDEQLYGDLTKALEENELILFAGAGLSAQAMTSQGDHPPLWRQLLEGMVDWSKERQLMDDDDVKQMRELIQFGFLLDAAQELEERIEPSDRQACLTEVLLYNDVEVSEVHRLVARIPFRAYLTTNYDDLLESAYAREHNRMLSKFYEHTYGGILNAFRGRLPFVIKLHGDVSNPDYVVMGNRSYDRLLYQNASYLSTLETVIGNASLLFVGFSGTDPNLEGILSRVSLFDGRIKRHWMVTQNEGIPDLRAKRLWKDKGITVIEYQGSHDNLRVFFEKLAQSIESGPNVEDRKRTRIVRQVRAKATYASS
jgi:hypothetical protein